MTDEHTVRIRDEDIARLRGMMGRKISRPQEDWEIEDSKFNEADIKRFARGIGVRWHGSWQATISNAIW